MLNAEEVRQIDRLAFGSFAVAPALSSSNARVARARGFGREFHDFRHYEPGDDPRSIDWTIHARLGQLVVRVFRADAHLRVHLLVDTSGSMAVGTPDKLSAARKIAAALCCIAVKQRDAVGVATFDKAIGRHLAPASGRHQLRRVIDVLGAAPAAGQSAANRALIDYGSAVHGPAVVVVISDFFHEEGTFEGLRYLLHRGLTPAVVQVVASEELLPGIDDDVELVDIENADRQPLVVNRRSVPSYVERMARLSADLGEFCTTHGLPCLRVESSFEFTQLIQACVRAGLLAGVGH